MSNALTVNAPEGLPIVEFEREFDAPVEAVFAAHQDPEVVKNWLGPRGYEMDIEQYDFVSGGSYRYVHRDPDGNSYAFRGVFHSIRPNELAIQTFEYEDYPDVVSLDHMYLDDLGDGRCRLRGLSVFPSLEARDGMVSSGMETGMTDGYERLDEILAAR